MVSLSFSVLVVLWSLENGVFSHIATRELVWLTDARVWRIVNEFRYQDRLAVSFDNLRGNASWRILYSGTTCVLLNHRL